MIRHPRPHPTRLSRIATRTLWNLCSCLLLCAGAAAAQPVPDDAGTPATTSREQALRTLRNTVMTREAVLISPRLQPEPGIAADTPAAEPAVRPDVPVLTPPAEDVASGAGRLPVSPGTDPAETAAPPPLVLSAAAPAFPRLTKGQLSTVALKPSEETLARQQVVELLRPSLPAASASLVIFPDLVRQLDQESKAVNLKPYVIVGKVMTYRRDTDSFVGELRVGVVDVLDSLTQRTLSRPLWFEVAESDLATPSSLQIDTAGTRPLAFAIAERRPATPFRVRVSSSFDQQGIDVPLRVKPTLFIETDRGTLQGLGLEKTDVHITSYGLENPEGTTISLSSPDSPHLDASILRLDKEGRASTSLRSDWPGPMSLSANAPGFDSVPVTIAVIWPLQTLVFSIGGGLLGGLIRLLPSASRGTSRRWWLALAVSIGIGLLVFTLAVLGVKVLPVDFEIRAGYVFVFAVSALGAWLGIRALDPLAPPKRAAGP